MLRRALVFVAVLAVQELEEERVDVEGEDYTPGEVEVTAGGE